MSFGHARSLTLQKPDNLQDHAVRIAFIYKVFCTTVITCSLRDRLLAAPLSAVWTANQSYLAQPAPAEPFAAIVARCRDTICP